MLESDSKRNFEHIQSILIQNPYKVNNEKLYFDWAPSVIINGQIEYVKDLNNKESYEIVNNNHQSLADAQKENSLSHLDPHSSEEEETVRINSSFNHSCRESQNFPISENQI